MTWGLTPGYELMAIRVSLQFLAFLGVASGGYNVPSTLMYLGRISYGLYVFHYLPLPICGSISSDYGIHGISFRFVGAASL